MELRENFGFSDKALAQIVSELTINIELLCRKSSWTLLMTKQLKPPIAVRRQKKLPTRALWLPAMTAEFPAS